MIGKGSSHVWASQPSSTKTVIPRYYIFLYIYFDLFNVCLSIQLNYKNALCSLVLLLVTKGIERVVKGVSET